MYFDKLRVYFKICAIFGQVNSYFLGLYYLFLLVGASKKFRQFFCNSYMNSQHVKYLDLDHYSEPEQGCYIFTVVKMYNYLVFT